MVDKKKLFSMGDEIQATIRAGELDRAVELLEEFLELKGTDRRWGLSLLQTVLKRIRENGVDGSAADAALSEQEQSIRDDLLAMDSENEAWMHQWERARQLNNQAWQDYEAAESQEELRAALTYAEQSLEFWPYFLPHLDTKVRCLLKLGRKEEAFACVRWVEAVQPDWPDFEDIRPSPEYQDWLAAHPDDPVELPDGMATLDQVLPRLDSDKASPPDQPLNEAERLLLRGVRYGKDEWHRARNAALIAVILDDDLPVSELISMGPQGADLTCRVYRSKQGELPIGFDSLAKLRHWLIYGSTNHPVAQLPNPPAGIREHLFIGWDLEKISRTDVEKLLGEIGKTAGINQLDLRRCKPKKIAGYERRTGYVRKPIG
jgi:tetratricopeptide (TPR) repeat protein